MIASRVSLLTRAGAATAATAIALAGAAVTGSAAGAATHHTRKLPTSLSIRLVKHTRHGFDVIRGQLRSHHVPLRHKTVLLESRTATTTFTVVDSARTGAHGVAAFKVTLPAETTKYKLVFAPHPNFRASHSGVVTIRIPSTTPPPPALRTSLSIRLVKHPKLGFDAISGQLRSHHVGLDGKTVLLESRTASTKFAVIDTGTTGLHGVVRFKEATPAETTRYKLVFEAVPGFRASHSGVVTVRIATPPPPVQLPTSLSIRLVKHPKQGFDAISGQLRSHHVGLDGKTVLLESRTASTKFAVIDTGTTGAHGVVSFKEAIPTETTRYKLVFEALPNFKASHSGVVTVLIKPAA